MKDENKFTGIYEGIVIQNNDPAGMGRVKVYIPQLHSGLVLREIDFQKNSNFSNFGENVTDNPPQAQQSETPGGDIDITQYIDVLRKKITEWARVIQPITGETGDMKYYSNIKQSTPSDSDDYESSIAVSEENDTVDGPGGRLDGFEDVWSSSGNSGGTDVNPNGGAYPYNKRFHQAKGSFGTIAVNTKVWVIFINGYIGDPLVIGSSPTATAAQGLLTPDIVGSEAENGPGAGESSVEGTIQRAGSVKNSGCMTEITKSVTGSNVYQRTHKSGSGESYLNDGTVSRISTANEQKAILGDEYQDIRNNKNVHISGQHLESTKDDYILRIGSLNVAAAQADKRIKEGIHDTKNLFETQRAEGGSVYSSTKQKRSGTFKPCPECSQDKELEAVNADQEKELGKANESLLGFLEPLAGKLGFKVPKTAIRFPGIEPVKAPAVPECKTCKGTGLSPYTYNGDWAPEPEKQKIQQMYEDAAPQIAAAEEGLGDGGNALLEVTRNMVINVGCAMNTMSDIRIDKQGKQISTGIAVGEERAYQKHDAGPLIEKTHVDNLAGGTLTINAGNGLNIISGARGLNLSCFGCTKIGGSHIDIGGAQVNISSKNEVNIASGAALNLKGSSLSMSSGGGQVLFEENVGVTGNLLAQGGAYFEGEVFVQHVTAPLELQPTEKSPILYGTTHPTIPKIIGFLPAGTVLAGQINVQPGEMKAGGDVVSGTSQGTITLSTDVAIVSIAGGKKPDDGCLYIYPHNHLFRNLPLTLGGSNAEIRKAATACEGKEPVPPTEPKNELKGPDSLKDKNFVDGKMYDKNIGGDKESESFMLDLARSSS